MSYQGTTSDNNEITEEEDNISQAQRVSQAQQHQYQSNKPVNPSPPPPPPAPQEFTALTLKETGAMTSLSTESGGNINHEDDVTLFVAYDEKWEYDNKEWFFENSKSSTMDVPKRITLSEIIDNLYKQLKVDTYYRLKLEVHYRTTGSPWFPVTEIQNDKDLSVFISETSKTRLPLCVSRSLVWYAQADKVDEERRKDYATVFVEYNGKWYYDGKEWFFKNSKSSTIFVPKRITLSEITNILYEHLEVDKKLYRFDLKVQHGTEYPSQIKNNQDLSAFISKTSKTKLSLFVTRIYDYQMSSDVAGEKRKDHVTLFVAYDGKWEYDNKEWFFKNSEGSMLVVPKDITLSEITDNLTEEFSVYREFYHLKLEVHWTGSPWFPVIQIQNDKDLSVFISETSKTKLPLCVTRLKKNKTDVVTQLKKDESDVDEKRRKDDTVEKRIMKAIRKDDWVKAREIVNTEEVTWTSKLDGEGNTAFHFAVGEYKNIEVVGDIMRINSELLVTTVNGERMNPVHAAARFGNTEALKIMLDSNPKCLFIPDCWGDLPINSALKIPAIETFQYLFKKMQSDKDEFDTFLKGQSAFMLLGKVIDTGLIDVPIESNSVVSTKTADEENQETPKKDKFVTKYTKDVISRICVKFWETTLLHVPHVKHLKEDKVKHNTTIKLLRLICKEVDRTYTSSEIIERLCSSPFCLAVENNTDEAIEVLTTYLPQSCWFRKDGQNVFQLTVLNRSEKVYSYILHHGRNAKFGFSISDADGNNILHLAGRLSPIHKLASRPALQMQKELQWFEEVKRVVGTAHTRALNKNKETPMMVFRKEHKELRKDGEEWMKKTADSYTITATLIITIVFAAAITVPGGTNDKTGKPIYEMKPSFIIFAVSDAISLFTATTSLLSFLYILTARYVDEDFLYHLPKRLIYGLVLLFVSVISMMIAFGATLYIMFGQGKQWIMIPIGALACLPIASFVTLQFPLLVDLIYSTYGPGYFGKERDYRQSSANANKKKRA